MEENKIEITASLEDYLEAIYFIGKNDESNFARVTDVAKFMNISKPSVNKAVNNLKKQNLVVQEKYGALQLTDNGLEVAKKIAKGHVIIKKFLTDVLGVEDIVAENEACLIEHLISSDTLGRLTKLVEKETGESKEDIIKNIPIINLQNV